MLLLIVLIVLIDKSGLSVPLWDSAVLGCSLIAEDDWPAIELSRLSRLGLCSPHMRLQMSISIPMNLKLLSGTWILLKRTLSPETTPMENTDTAI